MPQLGTAEDYRAFIVDSATQEVQGELPWSEIQWQRKRNDISAASVAVAEGDGGIDCCRMFGGLFPWSQMLRIERDGLIVWDGPVTGWARPKVGPAGARGFTVRASDRFIITQKRLVAQTRVAADTPPNLLAYLLADARIGNTAYDPYPIAIPGSSGIRMTTTAASSVAPDGSQATFQRDFRVERLEKVYDVMQELVAACGLFYTCVGSQVFMDEASLRTILGGKTVRPVLSEATTFNLPGINVDGLGMASVAYVGASSTGDSGFPVIRFDDLWRGSYITSTLETGRTAQRATLTADVYKEARIAAAQSATPNMTIEQVELAPSFGGRRFKSNLSNLFPGVVVDVNYEDTCAFDMGIIDIGWERRDDGQNIGVNYYQLTPYISSTISQARVDQIDVAVNFNDSGMSEVIALSLTPQVDWDGTLPAYWPTYQELLARG